MSCQTLHELLNGPRQHFRGVRHTDNSSNKDRNNNNDNHDATRVLKDRQTQCEHDFWRSLTGNTAVACGYKDIEM